MKGAERRTETLAARLRRWLRLPRSLRAQLALGSALIAVGALLLVALTALLGSLLSFNEYQGTQLQGEVNQVAEILGHASTQGPLRLPSPSVSGGALPRQRIALNIWIADASGQLATAPLYTPDQQATYDADQSTIVPALHRALAGRVESGTLPGSWLALTQRYYAVAPIHQDAAPDRPIIGAVALSTLPRQSRAEVFGLRLRNSVFIGTVAVGLLAALLALLFSRRLTQPVAHLTAATERMAAGDYGARVAVNSPQELHLLAESFNGMAAALEADVAQLRRQEQLRRELIANVSHELATPLTAIQGFTEALLDDVVSDPQERSETTRLIAREAARLERLVGQLRQVALFEAGAAALQRTAVALPALVAETLAVLAPELERKHIVVSSEMPPNLPPVYADADRLTEILLNLLDNAIHHTPDDGRIRITASVSAGAGAMRVSIADSGPGVAAAERERIFERFYRLDTSRTAATGGSGLGLAIVRALVEAHRGTISLDEAPEGGARFTFTLPLAPQG
ncbi:MAG TPA: ATP-binding protein [Ktedonobacterales bacterium]|nr:ATP-binding protein [Ktedonobacterales bacterium]